MEFGRRRPARRAERRRRGAGQSADARTRAAGRCRQSDVSAAGSAARDDRPRRRRRSGKGRADPPLRGGRQPSSRANSTASPRRPSARAATVRGSSRCSAASRRSAVRSTARSSRCAAIWTRSPPASSGCAAAAVLAIRNATTSAARCCWRWRRTIAGRNTPTRRGAAAIFSIICSATTITRRRAIRSRPAIRDLSHGLRAQLRRRLFPDLVRHRAEPVSR